MEKYDIPISFKVVAKTENEAIFMLQKFLKMAILTLSYENEILEHDVIEYISDSYPQSPDV